MIEIRVAYWPEQRDRQALKAIRYAVFVDEQQVPADEEMDAFDETSVHLLASSNETGFIGCARIMPSGQIGRMAVLKRCRGDGIGSQLMTAAIAEAKRQNLETVFLHAQCHAETFYARFGFVASGDIFDEAGIEHIKMILPS